MKLISWNVNGLRACLQKGFLDFFNSVNADFFCLQETKLQEGQVNLDLPGYEQYWCYAEKKGYSGTAIFTKHTPLSVRYGLGVPELDTEGRLITLEYQEFYLVTCYTPNAQRELARLNHRMRWDDAFRSYITQLNQAKPVIVCGDLNVAHQPIDLKNPSANRGSAGFSDEERESFSKTLAAGFTDTFRHLNPEATGCYTWWSYMFKARQNNAGWRIDYFLVSDTLKQQVMDAPIYADILGSDHCPVGLVLDSLCNGGIWSPETGKASIKEEEKKEKEKRSPAGGIALGSALCALAVAGCLFLESGVIPTIGDTDDGAKPDPYLHEFTPTFPDDQYLNSNIRYVTTVSFPQGLEKKYSSDSYSSYLATYFTDGKESWLMEAEDPEFTLQMSQLEPNFYLKVELTALGQRYVNTDGTPIIICADQKTDGNSILTVRRFYKDGVCMGWFIYGYITTACIQNIQIPMYNRNQNYTLTYMTEPGIYTDIEVDHVTSVH